MCSTRAYHANRVAHTLTSPGHTTTAVAAVNRACAPAWQLVGAAPLATALSAVPSPKRKKRAGLLEGRGYHPVLAVLQSREDARPAADGRLRSGQLARAVDARTRAIPPREGARS
jgi:hypothetical protein